MWIHTTPYLSTKLGLYPTTKAISKAQPKGGGRTRLVEPGQEQQGPRKA